MKSNKSLRSRIALEYEQAKYTAQAQDLCEQILEKLKLNVDSNGFPLSAASQSILRRSPTDRTIEEVCQNIFPKPW